MKLIIQLRAHFLSLAQSKHRLCSANHRSGYWSNLPCDWPSTAWAYSKQETENGPWSQHWIHTLVQGRYKSLDYILVWCLAVTNSSKWQRILPCQKIVQWNSLITLLIIRRYQTWHDNNQCRANIRPHTHKIQSVSYPHKWRIEWLLWVFWRKMVMF